MIAPVRTVLMVDAVAFSEHPDAAMPGLHRSIRSAVKSACERSGLLESWRDARVLESTGDGVYVVLPYQDAARLIDPFARSLQDVLSEMAPRLRAARQRLRLRVALHAGSVDDTDPVTGGVSGAAVEVARLLDSSPLRNVMRESDPDVTFCALIVSEAAFKSFVSGGHTGLRPSQFTPVHVTVKQYDDDAYLYVPVPSSVPNSLDPEAVEPISPPGSDGISVHGVSVKGGQNVIGARVSGGIRQGR
jgi:hypothetical protein